MSSLEVSRQDREVVDDGTNWSEIPRYGELLGVWLVIFLNETFVRCRVRVVALLNVSR